MLSYWERRSFLQYDFIIIGSGIVGISTALSLRERASAATILVLERGVLPSGASTKNAGFACIGSLTELLDDLAHLPEEEVLQLVSMRLRGLQRLRDRAGDQSLGYETAGSYELIREEEVAALDHLEEINALLRPLLKGDAFRLADARLDDFQFNKKYVRHCLENCFEGSLDSGKMMRTLLKLAAAEGIDIRTGAEVLRWEEESDSIKVFVKDTCSADAIAFSARKLLVCNNAFAATLLPGIDLKPGRGQVILTEPVASLPFKGIFHYDRGYYYFRELDGRVLLGGGRHRDVSGEETWKMELSGTIQQDLEDQLQRIILPGRHIEIGQRWSGIMAFGPDKRPLIAKYSDRLYAGVRMGGMGIAIGSEVGARLAALAFAQNE